jgi:replicative DNA helicase
VRAALRPRSLTVLASRPSHGKSALTLGLATDMARTHQTQVALACLEMSKHEVAMRLMAATASVDLQRLRTGRLRDSDWVRLTRHLGILADLNVSFIDTQFGLSLTDLGDHCLKLTQQRRLDLLVVDYIQLLTAEPEAPGMFCDPHEALARLKHLAIELDLAVVAVSQLSRRAEEHSDQPPQLTDLLEYRAAVQAADLIGLLHTRGPAEPWPQVDPQAAQLLVVHHHFGPTGVVALRFDRPYCRLTDPLTVSSVA